MFCLMHDQFGQNHDQWNQAIDLIYEIISWNDLVL